MSLQKKIGIYHDYVSTGHNIIRRALITYFVNILAEICILYYALTMSLYTQLLLNVLRISEMKISLIPARACLSLLTITFS